MIPAIAFFAVAVLGCLGIGVFAVTHAADTAAKRPNLTLPTDSPGGSRDLPQLDDEDDPKPTGPQASNYPVREDNDLERVCDQWYYPQSPKFAGKAPHQISVGLIDSKDTSRSMKSSVDVPYSLPMSVQKAWMPRDPAKTQIVACVDLIATGSQVRKCKFDNPPESIALKRGGYRLRLLEVATGRTLLDKKIPGDDLDCPYFALIGADRTIYTTPADRSLYELLKPYVMKK